MFHTSPTTTLVVRALVLALLCSAAAGPAAAQPQWPTEAEAVPPPLGSPPPFPNTTSSFEAIHHLPAVAYNTQRHEFLVVWHTEYAVGGGTRDIWGQFVRGDGQLLGEPFLITSETNYENFQPAVAYDYKWNRYLVVWVRSPNADGSGGDIYGRFIPFTGPSYVWQPFPICEWSTSQWGPKVAYTVWPIDNPSFMVVWWTDPGPYLPNYVSGRKIDEYGAMGSPFPISPSETTQDRHMPDIAATPVPWPNRYLVVYEMMHEGANSEVRGRFLDVAGNPQGEEFAISDSGNIYGLQRNPAVASCGNDFAVLYQRSVNQYDIYVQFVDHYGYKLGNILRLASTTAHEEDPDVACGGDLDRYVATWSQEYAGTSGIGIMSALVFADGTIGPYRLLIRPAAGPLNRYHPAIASDFRLFQGGQYGFLMAAEAERPAGMMGIYGATVLTAGTWLPALWR